MDGRAHRRFVVDKEIECLFDGRQEWVFLYNLSVGGCMLEVSHGQLRVGESMLVKLTHFIEAHGRVVWQFGGNAGVRFEEQLPEMLVERLGFQPTTTPFEDMSPRDRFGRLLPDLPPYKRESATGL